MTTEHKKKEEKKIENQGEYRVSITAITNAKREREKMNNKGKDSDLDGNGRARIEAIARAGEW